MSHTYHKIWLHYIWSTKNREKIITKDFIKELIPHFKEYGEENNIYIDTINAVSEHAHALIRIDPAQAPAQVANLIKGESSNWINKTDLLKTKFAWQEGYSAFSVSASQVDKVRKYIKNQENIIKK